MGEIEIFNWTKKVGKGWERLGKVGDNSREGIVGELKIDSKCITSFFRSNAGPNLRINKYFAKQIINSFSPDLRLVNDI